MTQEAPQFYGERPIGEFLGWRINMEDALKLCPAGGAIIRMPDGWHVYAPSKPISSR